MQRSFITYLALLFFYLLTSCNRSESKISLCSKYPAQIDSLQIQDIYDSARWHLYSWLADRNEDGNYRGQFPIIYKDFFQRNDTIELFFWQYTISERKLPHNAEVIGGTNDSTRHRCSVAFNLKTKKPLWCFDINGFSSGLGPGDNKFENTRSDSLLKFINVHKPILDPCFLELARKIGFIE